MTNAVIHKAPFILKQSTLGNLTLGTSSVPSDKAHA